MSYSAFLCGLLDEWVEGRQARLIITLPPRHGKSELSSRRLPAFILGKYPDANIIATSYSADLAKTFSRDVQNIMVGNPYHELFPDTMLADQFAKYSSKFRYIRTVGEFEVVGHSGSYRCAGVGGGITGHGAHFIIVDDPIKNRQEADSMVYRDMTWSFFISTLMTRLEPFMGKEGRILILVQKLEGWKLVNFPAIKGKDKVEYDERAEGEALWEKRFPAAYLRKRREAIGLREYASLYDGTPHVSEGTIFKREWLNNRYTELPDNLQIVQSYDTAFKEKTSNDYSVCGTWGLKRIGTQILMYLLHVWRERVSYPKLLRMSKDLAAARKPNLILVEDRASGQSLVQSLHDETDLPVIPVQVDISKTARAHSTTGKFEAGKVFLPESAEWLYDYLEEMYKFPSGAFDDQVDMTTLLINWAISLQYEDEKRDVIERGDVMEEYSDMNVIRDLDAGVL